jgi:hypothetical protein
VGTYQAPDVDMWRYRRLGFRVTLQVDVIPPRCMRLLGPDAYEEAQDDEAYKPYDRAAWIRATACPNVSDLDGRPS